jgi:YcxB-like protein
VLLITVAAVSLIIVGPRWWTLVLLPLAIFQWFNLSNPYRLQTRFFFKRNPKFLETYRLSFSDNGIRFKTDSIDSNIAWTRYSRVLEDKQVILLVYGSRMYTVIPKRVFRDSAQLAAFSEMVRRHIASEKQNAS